MRPAFVVGVIGGTSIAPELEPAIERRVRAVLRFLKYGADAHDPDDVHADSAEHPRRLGDRLREELGATTDLATEVQSWRGLPNTDLLLVAESGAGAASLARRVAEELARFDPRVRFATVEGAAAEADAVVRHAELLLAIYESDADETKDTQSRVSSWLHAARGPIIKIDTSKAVVGGASIHVLVDPIDVFGGGTPAAQHDRERRVQAWRTARENAHRTDHILELDDLESYVAPADLHRSFDALLDRTPHEAHELESALRSAGHTQFVIDLKALAALHARAERGAQTLRAHLAVPAIAAAIAAVLSLHFFVFSTCASALRAGIGFIALLFAALSFRLYHLQRHGQRQRLAEECRAMATAARVQFAWALAGSSRSVADHTPSYASATWRAMLQRIRSATFPLQRFAEGFAALSPALKARTMRAVVRHWTSGEASALRDQQSRLKTRRAQFANATRMCALVGLSLWTTLALSLWSGDGAALLDQRATVAWLAIWIFAWLLGPFGFSRQADLEATWVVIVSRILCLLPLTAFVLWIAIGITSDASSAFVLVMALGSTALMIAAVGWTFLDLFASQTELRYAHAALAVYQRARYQLEASLAPLERSSGTATEGFAVELAQQVRQSLHEVGQSLLDHRGVAFDSASKLDR